MTSGIFFEISPYKLVKRIPAYFSYIIRARLTARPFSGTLRRYSAGACEVPVPCACAGARALPSGAFATGLPVLRVAPRPPFACAWRVANGVSRSMQYFGLFEKCKRTKNIQHLLTGFLRFQVCV